MEIDGSSRFGLRVITRTLEAAILKTSLRLSDTALAWMLASAASIPNGLRYEPSLLQLFPDPRAMQHNEVKAGLGIAT